MLDSTPDVRAAVEAEHDRLKMIMSDLGRHAALGRADHEPSTWRSNFARSLHEFRRRLLMHFELEEEGGFFGDILQIAPQQFGRVRELEAAHSSIIASLDLFIRFVENSEGEAMAGMPAIRAQLNHLVETIRAHEAEEGELVQDAYYQDYGVCG